MPAPHPAHFRASHLVWQVQGDQPPERDGLHVRQALRAALHCLNVHRRRHHRRANRSHAGGKAARPSADVEAHPEAQAHKGEAEANAGEQLRCLKA